VGTMTPRKRAPATKGPSNLTPNHSPNSFASVRAFQTRAREAISSTRFSIRSVTPTPIRNLQVADSIVRRRHRATLRLNTQDRRAEWSTATLPGLLGAPRRRPGRGPALFTARRLGVKVTVEAVAEMLFCEGVGGGGP